MCDVGLLTRDDCWRQTSVAIGLAMKASKVVPTEIGGDYISTPHILTRESAANSADDTQTRIGKKMC